jgi:hypothetical protein
MQSEAEMKRVPVECSLAELPAVTIKLAAMEAGGGALPLPMTLQRFGSLSSMSWMASSIVETPSSMANSTSDSPPRSISSHQL